MIRINLLTLVFALTWSMTAHAESCAAMMQLLQSPPGVISPEQAQEIANSYNAECLGQTTQSYQAPSSDEDAAAAATGQILGQIIGGAINRGGTGRQPQSYGALGGIMDPAPGGSYLDRAQQEGQDALLATAPCDPAAREQWKAWLRSQARGNYVGDLDATPPQCR